MKPDSIELPEDVSRTLAELRQAIASAVLRRKHGWQIDTMVDTPEIDPTETLAAYGGRLNAEFGDTEPEIGQASPEFGLRTTASGGGQGKVGWWKRLWNRLVIKPLRSRK